MSIGVQPIGSAILNHLLTLHFIKDANKQVLPAKFEPAKVFFCDLLVLDPYFN